ELLDEAIGHELHVDRDSEAPERNHLTDREGCQDCARCRVAEKFDPLWHDAAAYAGLFVQAPMKGGTMMHALRATASSRSRSARSSIPTSSAVVTPARSIADSKLCIVAAI